MKTELKEYYFPYFIDRIFISHVAKLFQIFFFPSEWKWQLFKIHLNKLNGKTAIINRIMIKCLSIIKLSLASMHMRSIARLHWCCWQHAFFSSSISTIFRWLMVFLLLLINSHHLKVCVCVCVYRIWMQIC